MKWNEESLKAGRPFSGTRGRGGGTEGIYRQIYLLYSSVSFFMRCLFFLPLLVGRFCFLKIRHIPVDDVALVFKQ